MDPQPLPRPRSSQQEAPSIGQAQHWCDSLARAGARLPALDWARSRVVGTAVLAPFQEPRNLFAHSPGQGYRYLLVTREPGAGLGGQLVEVLVPDKSLAAAQAPQVAWDAYAQHRARAAGPLASFSGRVLFYSLAYHYEEGYVYGGDGAAPQPTRLVLVARSAPSAARADLSEADLPPPPANLFACTPVITD